MDELGKLSDEDVADHIRSKDSEAFLEIMNRYQEKLFRYVKYLIHDEAKAADVVQNTFIKAFKYLNNFDKSKKFSTWIYRIAHNETINEVMKYKNELPLFDDVDHESEENIEEEYAKKETQEMIMKCLGKMPVIYSEPLSLMFLEEKTYEEISDILRIPIGTVGTRINRAKKIMKKICQTKIS